MAASATSADISLTAHFPDRDLDAMVATANSYLTGDAEGASLDVQIVELLVAVTISIERGQITHAERFLEAAEALAPRTTWLFFVTAVDVLWAIVRRNQDRLAEAAAHLAVARDAPFTASDADRVASIVASSPLLRKALSLMLAELNAALQQQPAADAGIGGTTRPQWWLNPDELSRHSLPPALSGVRAVRANTDFTPSSSEHRFLAFRQGETFCVLARHSRTMFKAQHKKKTGFVWARMVELLPTETGVSSFLEDETFVDPDDSNASHSSDGSSSSSCAPAATTPRTLATTSATIANASTRTTSLNVPPAAP